MTAKPIRAIIETPPAHWVGDGFLVRPLFADLASPRRTAARQASVCCWRIASEATACR